MAFGRKKQQSSSEISREELTRTQVLNLQELERVAKFEKQTSKRPAVLFALAGVVAITMGIFYPNIMMAVDNIDSKPKTAYRVDLNKKYNETTFNEYLGKCHGFKYYDKDLKRKKGYAVEIMDLYVDDKD